MYDCSLRILIDILAIKNIYFINVVINLISDLIQNTEILIIHL